MSNVSGRAIAYIVLNNHIIQAANCTGIERIVYTLWLIYFDHKQKSKGTKVYKMTPLFKTLLSVVSMRYRAPWWQGIVGAF